MQQQIIPGNTFILCKYLLLIALYIYTMLNKYLLYINARRSREHILCAPYLIVRDLGECCLTRGLLKIATNK